MSDDETVKGILLYIEMKLKKNTPESFNEAFNMAEKLSKFAGKKNIRIDPIKLIEHIKAKNPTLAQADIRKDYRELKKAAAEKEAEEKKSEACLSSNAQTLCATDKFLYLPRHANSVMQYSH